MRFDWLTAPLIVAVLCGSLAGSIFTWWVNREDPLVVGYVVSTTSTGTDATTKTLVPGLSLRINSKDIPAIHTHVISISRTSGFAPDLSLAATLAPVSGQNMEVFGSSFDAPSPVHHINCEMIATGTKCNLGPMDGQGVYRISLATNVASPPQLAVAGKDVRLAALSEIAQTEFWWTSPKGVSVLLMTASVMILTFTTLEIIVTKLFGKKRRKDETPKLTK